MSDKNTTRVVLADAAGIARAAVCLAGGGLVAVPTETVYGLAARADSPEAVAKIYAAKGRPQFNPLIVHVRGVQQAKQYARWSDHADFAAESHWPGPLTLVLPKNRDAQLAAGVTAGLDTVALRAPQHPVMRALLDQIDFPLAAPSANRSGFISPASADHVLASLDGRVDLILDAGPCEQGLESSILAIRANGRWEELRPGPVDLDALHRHYFDVGLSDQSPSIAGERIEAPGQLASHYSPGKPVRLNAAEPLPGEFYIGFGGGGSDFNLSPGANLKEAASRLYDALHQAAASDMLSVAVAPIPEEKVGRAINDRLRRAAAPPD